MKTERMSTRILFHIKNIGSLPCEYVFMALFADTLDYLEWKSGIVATA